MDKIVTWKCRAGHVMGQVTRNGSGIRKLLLYRQATDCEDAVGVDVLAVVEGYVVVTCSICGQDRTWVPGEEAIRQLMERMGRKFKEAR